MTVETEDSARLPTAESSDAGAYVRAAKAAINGDKKALAKHSLAEIFAQLCVGAASGVLLVKRRSAIRRVYFRDGKVVFAESTESYDHLTQTLMRDGRITRAQAEKAASGAKNNHWHIGQALVEGGYIGSRELLPLVRRQVQEIVYSLFALRDGSCEFLSEEFSERGIEITRHSAAIVLEGVRRHYNRSSDLAFLPALEVKHEVINARALSDVMALIDTTASERAMVRRLDGTQKVADLIEGCHLEDLEAQQLLYVLELFGYIRKRTAGSNRPSSDLAGKIRPSNADEERAKISARLALVQRGDYFQILGVRRDASDFEIGRAYEAARREFALSGYSTQVQKELADELMDIQDMLTEAYEILGSERLRISYGQNLRD